MLINSVGGGGGEGVSAASYSTYGSPSSSFQEISQLQPGVSPQPGDTRKLVSLLNMAKAPEHIYLQGYVGQASWGWLFFNGVDILNEEVEAVFITPTYSDYGAGKRIRAKFWVQTAASIGNYLDYDLWIQVLESEVMATTAYGWAGKLFPFQIAPNE